MRARRANRNGRGTLLSAEFRPSRKTDPERRERQPAERCSLRKRNGSGRRK